MRRCRRSKLGRARLVEGDDLAVEHGFAHPDVRRIPRTSG